MRWQSYPFKGKLINQGSSELNLTYGQGSGWTEDRTRQRIDDIG